MRRVVGAYTLRWALAGVGVLCACGGRNPLDLLSGRPVSPDAGVGHSPDAPRGPDASLGSDAALGTDAALPPCAWEFAPQAQYPAQTSPECVAAGDLDGDGHLDLVVGNVNGQTISVFRNLGDGTFAAQVTYKNFQPESLALGDFDEDGRLDVVASNGNSGTVTMFRNLGGGKLDDGTAYRVGGYPMAITLADFDGDGHLDTATANNAGASLSILRNLGDGTFAAQATVPFGSGVQGVAAGDFDGDGHPDMVATNRGYSGPSNGRRCCRAEWYSSPQIPSTER